MNPNIFYNIGLYINNPNTFYNFITSIKNITNKETLIQQKRESFLTEIVTYYDNSSVIREEYYTLPNGKKEGIYKYYYDGGQLSTKCRYLNGKKEGLYEISYIDGKLHERSNFVNDKKEGICENWWDNGALYAKYVYNSGKREELYVNGSHMNSDIN
jgi:antitoxin component YwqK of YwqJK toxin-antitoxin module